MPMPRSRRSVARRLLVALPVAMLLVITGTGATLPSKPPSSPTAPAIPANNQYVDPPDITAIESLNLPNFEYQFTGFITDPGHDVTSLTVIFAGAHGLGGQTSVTLPVTSVAGSNTYGTFTVTVQLQANTTNSPLTYDWAAIAGDANGRTSDPVSCEIILQPQPHLP